MDRSAVNAGKWGKAGLAAFGLAILAVPASSAFASAEEPAAKLSDEQLGQARQIFTDWSCSQCHTLSDAGATGHIGPSFDGDANLDHDYIVGRITDGQGPMPGFGGQLTEDEIDLLAKYILQVKK